MRMGAVEVLLRRHLWPMNARLYFAGSSCGASVMQRDEMLGRACVSPCLQSSIAVVVCVAVFLQP